MPEKRASIDCALEILGTNSSENAVTPAAAAASIESMAVTGERKLIVTAPFFTVAIWAGVKGCTERTASALLRTSRLAIVAPALT